MDKIKHILVTQILANRTYTPESALWCKLYNRLMKMSKDDLSSLHLLITCKVTDCGGTGLVDLEDEQRWVA